MQHSAGGRPTLVIVVYGINEGREAFQRTSLLLRLLSTSEHRGGHGTESCGKAGRISEIQNPVGKSKESRLEIHGRRSGPLRSSSCCVRTPIIGGVTPGDRHEGSAPGQWNASWITRNFT